MLLELIIGLILAAVLSHIFLNLVKLADWLMDYGSYFWKVRYNYVYRNSSDEIKEFLSTQLSMVNDFDDPIAFMNDAYIAAYKDNWSIKRWICVLCMGIYVSLYFNLIIVLTLGYFGYWYGIISYLPSFYAYFWAFEKNIKS